MAEAATGPASARTVVVTGGSRGLGLAICRRLLSRGYHVIAIARQETEAYARLRGGYPLQAEFVSADLAERDGMIAACALLRTCSGLFALVNNAAAAVSGLHVTVSQDSMARLLTLNVHTPMALSQAAVKSMSRRRCGRIINISSVTADRTYRGLGVYTATKTALEGFSRVLAVEVGHWGISVNSVAPGFLDTDMTAVLPEAVRSRIARRDALPVRTSADHVAGVVEFLLSPAADTITAQVITVDSGATA
jgi:3-oxoacyl-[acyl-carrier protein] reductase